MVRQTGSLTGCERWWPAAATLPWRAAYGLQLWPDLAVELLQEFLHSFDLWRLCLQECEMSPLEVSRAASRSEIAKVLITIAFRKPLSICRLGRSHIFTLQVEQLRQGGERGGLGMFLKIQVSEINFLEKYIKKQNKNTRLKTSEGNTVSSTFMFLLTKLEGVNSTLQSRAVQPVACGLHAAQDGYECGPIQNHNFT